MPRMDVPVHQIALADITNVTLVVAVVIGGIVVVIAVGNNADAHGKARTEAMVMEAMETAAMKAGEAAVETTKTTVESATPVETAKAAASMEASAAAEPMG